MSTRGEGCSREATTRPEPALRTLVMFVKQPVPGRVKTRLAADLGDEFAARLYAAFTAELVRRCRALGDRRILAHAPDDPAARRHFETVVGDSFDLWPQAAGGLGERLVAAFERAFAAGGTRVVVIGSDTPHLPVEHVERAFDLLATYDCTLGPATDGGYYLVGLRRPIPEMFERIDWSTARVLSQTLERLEALGNATRVLLPSCFDVDSHDDLVALRALLRSLRLAGRPVDLPVLEPLLEGAAIDAALSNRKDL